MHELSEWPAPAKALAGLFAAAMVAAVWSVLASSTFLLGTGLIRTFHGLPFIEWWVYWWAYGFQQPVVGTWLKVSAVLAAGVPLLFAFAGLMRRGLPGAIRPLHGATRWARPAELRREFRAKFGGIYLGYTPGLLGRRNYLRFGGPEHVACYAPTRSGKGVGLVIPNCLLYEASLVCLDVKKENWAATAGIRAAAGQKVFLFDPLAPDGRTARYNPLGYVRRGTMDAFDDIQRIAQMLFPHEDGPQAFWTDSARSAFVGATAFIAETPELPLTIGEVLRLLSRADGSTYLTGQIEARRVAGKRYTEATVQALEDYLRGSADTVAGIRKTMTAKLSLWYNPRIDAATSANDFDLRQVRQSLHAIYVGVTPDNIARLRPLLALFFQQLIDLTVRTLPQFDTTAKHQVLILLDEFPLLGPMPVLADAFSFVAGYGIRLMLVMQSKAQIRDPALYGPDKATSMLENCGVEVVFGTKGNELAKELSERLGYDTVDGISRSGPRFWRALRGTRVNETESDQRRALLLPQEITRLRPHECIVLRTGTLPIRARRIRWFSDKFFSRLKRKPPAIEPIEVVERLDQGGSTPGSAANPPAGPTPPQPAPAPQEAPSQAAVVPAEQIVVKDDGDVVAVEPAPETLAMEPHQADALLNSIAGTDIDLSAYALQDGKAMVATITGSIPTTVSRGRRRLAAE